MKLKWEKINTPEKALKAIKKGAREISSRERALLLEAFIDLSLPELASLNAATEYFGKALSQMKKILTAEEINRNYLNGILAYILNSQVGLQDVLWCLEKFIYEPGCSGAKNILKQFRLAVLEEAGEHLAELGEIDNVGELLDVAKLVHFPYDCEPLARVERAIIKRFLGISRGVFGGKVDFIKRLPTRTMCKNPQRCLHF